MSMHVYQFGTTTLPGAQYAAQVPLQTPSNTLAVLGGHYDPNRSDRAPVRFPLRATVTAYVLAATNSALGTALDTLRGLAGVRDRLWANPYDTAQADRWCWARLISVPDAPAYNSRIWQRIELGFELLSHWSGSSYGGAWDLDAGYYFDSGLYFDATGTITIGVDPTIDLANAGNRMVTNCGITFTSGSTATREVTFASTNCKFGVSGIVENDVLVVDCGAKTVLVNGADAYSRFALHAEHASANWFEIAAGGETITVGNQFLTDTVQFTYADGWY